MFCGFDAVIKKYGLGGRTSSALSFLNRGQRTDLRKTEISFQTMVSLAHFLQEIISLKKGEIMEKISMAVKEAGKPVRSYSIKER